MVLKKKKVDFKRLAESAAKAAADKKAVDIVVLDIHKDSDIADYVVIVEANSTTQLRALEGAVREALDRTGVRLIGREGGAGGRWIALDAGGLMVHVMLSEAREFYRLEKIWEHAKVLKGK